MMKGTNKRIETELEVKAYLQNLKFALQNGAKLDFQIKRRMDENRNEKYTNQYTVNTLFPNEDPIIALKRVVVTHSRRIYTDSKRFTFPEKK